MKLVALCTIVLGACNPGRESPTEVPESAEPTARGFVDVGRFAASLGAPLSRSARGLGDDETTAKMRIQESLGNGSDGPKANALGDPNCVVLGWVGLTLTVTYTDCVTSGGTEIDGLLTLGLTLVPLNFALGFGDLRVDSTTFDGSLDMGFTGEGNSTAVLGANVAIVDESVSPSVTTTLDQVTLSVGLSTVVIAGRGTVIENVQVAPPMQPPTTTFEAFAVTWDGQCLPTSGSLDYQDANFDVTLTFLPTTPTQGLVRVTSGVFEATVALLPACP